MKLILTLVGVFLGHLTFSQELKVVTTEWKNATVRAKELDRNILIVLTATEWCRPCIKMKRNVFENEEFINYSNDNLIIYQVELPKGESADTKGVHIIMNSEEYIEYDKLKTKYQAFRLPSLVLTDPNGEKIKLIEGKVTSLKNVMSELRNR